MNRWWPVVLSGVLLTGASGCSGENYRSLYEMESTIFSELNDYLMMVVDEETAKNFNNTQGKKFKEKFADIGKKLEGWEKLYSVDKDAMKVYIEMKLCLAVARSAKIKDLKVEELEDLDDASLIFRLVRDSWANSDRYDSNMARISRIKDMVQAKNESNTELANCAGTESSKLLYFGSRQAQGFGGPLQIPSLEKGSKVKIPERFKNLIPKRPVFGGLGPGGPGPGP